MSQGSRSPLLLFLSLLVLPFLPGCYVLGLAAGQLEILSGREDIPELLEREKLDPDLRRKLKLVLEVRKFAIEELGLTESGSYTQYYDTQGKPIAWNVSASEPDALAPYSWWFPLVGALPYVGFFELEGAQEEARRLRSEGLDTLILPIPAFSTLGWFDDPIFSPLLERDEATIVDTVIHELAHATVWIEGDGEFNENLATFVGTQGAKDFFLRRSLKRDGAGDPGLAQVDQNQQNEALFADAMAELQSELMRVYESTGPRSLKLALKKKTFAAFRTRYKETLRPRLTDDRYDFLLDEGIELNNAFVLVFQRYHGVLDLFHSLHRQEGGTLKKTVLALKELAQTDDPRLALEKRIAANKD